MIYFHTIYIITAQNTTQYHGTVLSIHHPFLWVFKNYYYMSQVTKVAVDITLIAIAGIRLA